MKTAIITGLILVSILGLGAMLFIFSSDQNNTEENNPQTNSVGSNEETTTTLEKYTRDEITNHSTRDDCWTIINNSVYDLTPYVSRHSGGDEILRACGVDSTDLFESRTTETGEEIGSGTPHSSDAVSELKQLKIGELSS